MIFLFFIWVTSSQAILTLTRLRGIPSWKVSAAMLLTLLLVVFTYLFAAERFTAFLYPDRQEVDAILARVREQGTRYVCVTGGEPLALMSQMRA